MNLDVVVAGAGPAGATAAHILARAGRSVLLVDRPPEGFRIGETLPAAGGRLLVELGLPSPATTGARPCGGVQSIWGGAGAVSNDAFASPDGHGWRLDRARFDAALRTAALVSGASFAHARLRAIAPEGAGWTVRLDTGASIQGSFLIDATGRSSWIARALGVRRRRGPGLISVFAHTRRPNAIAPSRSLVETTAEGWWYVAAPPKDRLVAAYHVAPSHARRLLDDPRGWRRALRSSRLVANWTDEARFRTALRATDASGGRLDRVHGSGWAACGDAAQAFDPISSQGLLSAIHDGAALARALLCSNASDALEHYTAGLAEVARLYDLRREAAYARELRWGSTAFWQNQLLNEG